MAHRERRPAREVHALYVALEDASPAGRQAAGFLEGVAAPLGARGVLVEVFRVRPKDLRDPRVLGAFRRRGISRLPAALAGGRPLEGLAEIRAHYTRLAREEPPPAGGGGGARRPRAGAPPRPGPAGEAFGPPGEAFGPPGEAFGPPGEAFGPPGGDPDEGESPEAYLEDYFRREMATGREGDEAGFGAA